MYVVRNDCILHLSISLFWLYLYSLVIKFIIFSQAWYEYYLWQLRKDELDHEKLSAAEFPEEISQIDNTSEQEQVRKELVQELKTKSVERKKIEEDIFINSCVLMAIKECFID